MGARLPNLDPSWAQMVVAGNDKRYIGAANAKAAGVAAIGQGIAAVAGDITRKKENARADAKWQAQFDLEKQDKQNRTDAANIALYSHLADTAQQQALQARAGGDEQAAQRFMSDFTKYSGYVHMITPRAQQAATVKQASAAPQQAGAGFPAFEAWAADNCPG